MSGYDTLQGRFAGELTNALSKYVNIYGSNPLNTVQQRFNVGLIGGQREFDSLYFPPPVQTRRATKTRPKQRFKKTPDVKIKSQKEDLVKRN